MDKSLVAIVEEKRTKFISKELVSKYGFVSSDPEADRLFDDLMQEKLEETLLTGMLYSDTLGETELTEEHLEPMKKRHRMYLWQK